MPQLTHITNRYKISQKLGQGGMGTVYQVYDRLEKQAVALKQVNTQVNDLQYGSKGSYTDGKMSIIQEFSLLASLRHPNVISVLDYGLAEGYPFFTMELVPDALTFMQVAEDKSEREQVELLIQILEALRYLHRRGIMHRDLKPDNVLVVGGNQVKVLDFGLSVNATIAKGWAGTLAYMAPETLGNELTVIQSDFYAVGVMAYQMITGELPFKADDIPSILKRPADLNKLGSHPAKIVIGRLLQKDPEDRYETADDCISALREALQLPRDSESGKIRESFLQASQFVGRAAEQQILRDELKMVMQGGNSFYLVGGESGVGKSRLLDELRISALVAGASVMQGQGVDGGGLPFQLWRNILPRLLLMTDIDDTQASILKDIVPDIEDIIGREVDADHGLTGSAYQSQLIEVIVGLIEQTTQPLVLLLEDLQWASESLEPIKQLLKNRQQLSQLMLVGSYRNDEAPDLPDILTGMAFIRLERLSTSAIQALSVSMLGQNGASDEVVQLLEKETEGNLFFLVETVRALAEEAGGLTQVGSATLPDEVFTVGMQQIMQRRLNKVNAGYAPIQTMAAIDGRDIDVDLLAHHFGLHAVQDWLIDAAANAILDLFDNKWRFAHDKLRQTVVSSLHLAELQTWHGKIVEVLEASVADQPGNIIRLARHAIASGNREKIIQYGLQAGQFTMKLGANRDSMRFYEASLIELRDSGITAENHDQFIQGVLDFARVGAFHDNPNIESFLTTALERVEKQDNEEQLARVLGSFGAHHYMKGQIGNSIGFFFRSMALAEKLNLEELLFLPYNILPRVLFFAGDLQQGNAMLEKGIALSEQYEDDEMLQASLAWMSNYLVVQGRLDEAHAYAERAIEMVEAGQIDVHIAGTFMLLTGAYVYEEGFERVLHLGAISLKIGIERDMLHQQFACRFFMAYAHMHYGNMLQAREYFEDGYQVVQDTGITVMVPYLLAWFSEFELAQGNIDRAFELATEGVAIGENTRQLPGIGEGYRALGLSYLHTQDFTLAQESLQKSIEAQEKTGFLNFLAKSYAAMAELYQQQGNEQEATMYQEKAHELFTRMSMRWQLGTAPQQ